MASNPSIERTSQRPLRALWPAAHVKRETPAWRALRIALKASARITLPSRAGLASMLRAAASFADRRPVVFAVARQVELLGLLGA